MKRQSTSAEVQTQLGPTAVAQAREAALSRLAVSAAPTAVARAATVAEEVPCLAGQAVAARLFQAPWEQQ